MQLHSWKINTKGAIFHSWLPWQKDQCKWLRGAECKNLSIDVSGVSIGESIDQRGVHLKELEDKTKVRWQDCSVSRSFFRIANSLKKNMGDGDLSFDRSHLKPLDENYIKFCFKPKNWIQRMQCCLHQPQTWEILNKKTKAKKDKFYYKFQLINLKRFRRNR